MSLSKKLGFQLMAIALISVSLSSCEIVKKQFGMDNIVDIPLGEYLGTATPLNSEEDKDVKEVKITFLPKEDGLKDAIGVLVLNNSSERFLWRSDGNNKNIWNVMFAKDNTMYTNIEDSFEFNGIIKSSELKNTLEGKFTTEIAQKEKLYYFKASQVFSPSLEQPKEAIAIKAGEEVSINATKIDPDKTKIFMMPVESETEPQEMAITNSILEKGLYTLTFSSSKDQSKGKYKVFIERDDGQKTKSIIIEIL